MIKKQSRSRRNFQKRPKTKKMPKKQPEKQKIIFNFKLFGRWDSNVTVNDPGLKPYINLEPKYIPRSAGAHRGRFHKSKMHIIERLALDLLIPGHTGKRHRLSSGKLSGNFLLTLASVEKALEIIEKKENMNPLQVLVKAIENAALREEIISYQLGSIMAREAVISAPQRRVDKTLKYFSQGSYRKAFNKKKGIENALADEILLAYKNSSESFAIREKERIEKEAAGAR